MKIDSFKREYGFLSNFYDCNVEFDGLIYPSSEHAFQAAKSIDILDRVSIQKLPTAAQAKKMGRNLTLRDNWELIKLPIMEMILRVKFNDPLLKEKLDNTRGYELIEGNTWGDNYWGVCRGKGQNNLGKILMRIRDEN